MTRARAEARIGLLLVCLVMLSACSDGPQGSPGGSTATDAVGAPAPSRQLNVQFDRRLDGEGPDRNRRMMIWGDEHSVDTVVLESDPIYTKHDAGELLAVVRLVNPEAEEWVLAALEAEPRAWHRRYGDIWFLWSRTLGPAGPDHPQSWAAISVYDPAVPACDEPVLCGEP